MCILNGLSPLVLSPLSEVVRSGLSTCAYNKLHLTAIHILLYFLHSLVEVCMNVKDVMAAGWSTESMKSTEVQTLGAI